MDSIDSGGGGGGGGGGEPLDPRMMAKSEIESAVTILFDKCTELGLSSVRKQDRNRIFTLV